MGYPSADARPPSALLAPVVAFDDPRFPRPKKLGKKFAILPRLGAAAGVDVPLTPAVGGVIAGTRGFGKADPMLPSPEVELAAEVDVRFEAPAGLKKFATAWPVLIKPESAPVGSRRDGREGGVLLGVSDILAIAFVVVIVTHQRLCLQL